MPYGILKSSKSASGASSEQLLCLGIGRMCHPTQKHREQMIEMIKHSREQGFKTIQKTTIPFQRQSWCSYLTLVPFVFPSLLVPVFSFTIFLLPPVSVEMTIFLFISLLLNTLNLVSFLLLCYVPSHQQHFSFLP